MLTGKQHRYLEAKIKSLKIDRARLKAKLPVSWPSSLNQLNQSQFDQLLKRLPDFARSVCVWNADGTGTLQRRDQYEQPYQSMGAYWNEEA